MNDQIYAANVKKILMDCILRIEVSPGIYECVATNLDREEFPPEIIKHEVGRGVLSD